MNRKHNRIVGRGNGHMRPRITYAKRVQLNDWCRARFDAIAAAHGRSDLVGTWIDSCGMAIVEAYWARDLNDTKGQRAAEAFASDLFTKATESVSENGSRVSEQALRSMGAKRVGES